MAISLSFQPEHAQNPDFMSSNPSPPLFFNLEDRPPSSHFPKQENQKSSHMLPHQSIKPAASAPYISLVTFSSIPFHPPLAYLISRSLQNLLLFSQQPAYLSAVYPPHFHYSYISKEKPLCFKSSYLPITAFTTGVCV